MENLRDLRVGDIREFRSNVAKIAGMVSFIDVYGVHVITEGGDVKTLKDSTDWGITKVSLPNEAIALMTKAARLYSEMANLRRELDEKELVFGGTLECLDELCMEFSETDFVKLVYQKLNVATEGSLALKDYRINDEGKPGGVSFEIFRVKKMAPDESEFFKVHGKQSVEYRRAIEILMGDNLKVLGCKRTKGNEKMEVSSKSEVQFINYKDFVGYAFIHRIKIDVVTEKLNIYNVNKIVDCILGRV